MIAQKRVADRKAPRTTGHYPYIVAGTGYQWHADAEEAALRLGACIGYRHLPGDGRVLYVTIPDSETQE
jgi:hypothetical protein